MKERRNTVEKNIQNLVPQSQDPARRENVQPMKEKRNTGRDKYSISNIQYPTRNVQSEQGKTEYGEGTNIQYPITNTGLQSLNDLLNGNMGRADGSAVFLGIGGRIKIRPYKMRRADGSGS